jgi:hypothetical protein
MEKNHHQHIGEETLEAYSFSRLGEEDLAAVEEHLLVCETCQKRLDQVESYARAMRGAARRIQQEEEGQAPATIGAWDRIRGWFASPVPLWGGAFATAALILILGLQVTRHLQDAPPGPPVDVELQAVRGTVTPNTADAGHALHLRLDSRGVPEVPVYRIEIVDAVGRKVWNGSGNWSDPWIQASVEKSFTPGTYFVRLLKDGEDPVREYQLTIRETK